MRAPVASFSKKLISTFFAAALAFGLIPAAAFAESSVSASADSIDTTSDETDIHEPTTNASQDEFVETGFILSNGEEGTGDNAMTGDDSNPDISSNDIINQEMPLDTVVAQAESTKSFFLAQTLESTRTVPVVSANLPLDPSQNTALTEADGNDSDHVISTEASGSERTGEISSSSTVVGSFEYLGMTFAIEAGGESVALVAADYAKLPEEFIEKQVVAIPSMVTPDGIDAYSVTRIADDAFAGFTKENANPDYIGCEALFSDEELLEEAGVDPVVLGEDDPLAGCTGILALGIPASVTTIEDNAFSGFDTLQYIVVSDDNPNYASYDGALYSVDLANLRLIPEGRVGTIRVAPSATTVEPEVFSHCPSVDTVVADPESAIYQVFTQDKLCDERSEVMKVTSFSEKGGEPFRSFTMLDILLLAALNDENHAANSNSSLYTNDAISYAATIVGSHVFGNGGLITVVYGESLDAQQTYVEDVPDTPIRWDYPGSGRVYSVEVSREAPIQYWSTVKPDYQEVPRSLFQLFIHRTGYTLIEMTCNGVTAVPSGSSYAALQYGSSYSASWTPNTYTVRFNLNEGEGTAPSSVTATYDASMPALSTAAKPTRDGYEFMGWYDDVDYTAGTQYYTAEGASAHTWAQASDATLYAGWKKTFYTVTYRDMNGDSLMGWTTESGAFVEDVLPQAFEETTSAAARALPKKLIKRGYTWVGWTYKGTTVFSIPEVSSSITIVANFIVDDYTVKVDLAGGVGTGWPENYVRTYNEPTIELPADNPKRAGYVFRGIKAYAAEEANTPAVTVTDVATSLPVDTLQPGHTYKVLNLPDSEGDVYDVKVLRAVWIPRIAIDVTPSVNMGILADFGTNTLKFQCGGTDYIAGATDNAYAPLEFVSYTTAPVGIVAVTDDTQDAGYATRAAFAEKVFGGASNKAKVSFTISSDPNGANSHSFSLGGSTIPSATGFLDGLTIAKPTGAETSKTTPFYLGMNFSDLRATDLLTKESGQIAKLYYTVALLNDPESESVLAPYDGNGILW